MNIITPAVIMISLDAIYLTTFKKLYNQQVSLVQGSDLKIKIGPAILVYGVLIFGLYYFILRDKKPIKDAVILGFVIYAVFELTNMAIFDKWNIKTAMLDSLWGAILLGTTTWATYRLL